MAATDFGFAPFAQSGINAQEAWSRRASLTASTSPPAMKGSLAKQGFRAAQGFGTKALGEGKQARVGLRAVAEPDGAALVGCACSGCVQGRGDVYAMSCLLFES